jgi:hypothetical protein
MGNESALVPVAVTDRGIIDEICRFRVRVWAATGCLAAEAFPDGIWRDLQDDACTHLAILSGAELLAAARWSLCDLLEQVPDAEQYRRIGLELEGPIALPERIVVSPFVPHLNLAAPLLVALDNLSRAAGARYAVGQASGAMARMLEQRGRCRIVGSAAPDPRFMGVQFYIVVREL